MGTVAIPETKTMLTMPSDAVRQILWRYADRFDLQMLVQSARGVARGAVARLVAAGERNTHEWTAAKDEMLNDFDRAGISAAFMEPEEGGFIVGRKTSHSASQPTNWRGSMAAQPRQVSQDSSRCRPFTSVVRPSRSCATKISCATSGR